jgi:hypothetical protein
MSRPALRAPLLLASLLLVAGCSSPSTPAEPSLRADRTESSDEHATGPDADRADSRASARASEGVARASAAEVTAFMAADPAKLAALWSDEFVVTNPFNQFVGKPQVLALVSGGILAFSSYDRTIEYSRSYGNLVIVAGSETVVWSGRMPLAGQTSHLRYTAVWERQGHVWRQVARHANLVLPAVPGGPPTP